MWGKAVVDQLQIEQITKGVAQAGAFRFSANNNVSDTYKGPVYTGNGKIITAILKDIPIDELVKEIFIAVLGRALGLPIPRPLLVATDNGIVSAKHAPTHKDGHVLYGSELVGSPSLGQICINGTYDAIPQELLKRWKKAGQAYSFDTWTANIDRHLNNIMFDGIDEVWLIDHGRTFNDAVKLPTESTDPTKISENKMDLWLTNKLEEESKVDFASAIADLTHQARNVALEAVASACKLDKLIRSTKEKRLISYLRQRVDVTNVLAKNSSGLDVPLLR